MERVDCDGGWRAEVVMERGCCALAQSALCDAWEQIQIQHVVGGCVMTRDSLVCRPSAPGCRGPENNQLDGPSAR
eukprot:1032642-Rhodomonas_salina.1